MTMRSHDILAAKHWVSDLNRVREQVRQDNRLDWPDFVDGAPERAAAWLRGLPDDIRLAVENHDVLRRVAMLTEVALFAPLEIPLSSTASFASWERALSNCASHRVEPPIRRRLAGRPATRNPKAFVCVEDEAGFQEQLRDLIALEFATSQLVFAGSLASAKAEVRKLVSTHEPSDVFLVLDLGIPAEDGGRPDRANGMAFLDWLRKPSPSHASGPDRQRKTYRHWPVLILSRAADSLEDAKAAASFGVEQYLPKSFRYADFSKVVRDSIEARPYDLDFPEPGVIALDGVRCELSPQAHELLWQMSDHANGSRTAAAWGRMVTGRAGASDHEAVNAFHNLRSQIVDSIKATFESQRRPAFKPHRLFDQPSSPAPDDTSRRGASDEKNYSLVASVDGAVERRRVDTFQVLVVDDDPVFRSQVTDLLTTMRYDVRAQDFHGPCPHADGWRPDAVCLDLVDAADPEGWEEAGVRWLRNHQADLPLSRIVVLSSVAADDLRRSQLLIHFDVDIANVVSKQEDWNGQLLSRMHRLYQERITGYRVAVDNDGIPVTLVKQDGEWLLVHPDEGLVRCLAGYRTRLIDVLADNVFATVSWDDCGRHVYESEWTDPESGKGKLKSLVSKINKLLGERLGHASLGDRVIRGTADGYSLHAHAVPTRD